MVQAYSVALAYLTVMMPRVRWRLSSVSTLMVRVSVKCELVPFPMLDPTSSRGSYPQSLQRLYFSVAIFTDSAVPSAFNLNPCTWSVIPGMGCVQVPSILLTPIFAQEAMTIQQATMLTIAPVFAFLLFISAFNVITDICINVYTKLVIMSNALKYGL